jgi:pilus assembly protein Flp/PilA
MANTVRRAPAPDLTRLIRADDGAAAIEYGLLAALIAGVLLIGLTAIGSSLGDRLSQLGAGVGAAGAGTSGAGAPANNGNGKGGNGKGNNGNGKGNGGPAG